MIGGVNILFFIMFYLTMLTGDSKQLELMKASFDVKTTPYLAMILRKAFSAIHCGGSIVSPKHILTTCSCVGTFSDGKHFDFLIPDEYSVVAGAEKMEARIEKFMRYPKCSVGKGNFHYFNLGACVLSTPLKFGERVSEMKVYQGDDDIEMTFFSKHMRTRDHCIAFYYDTSNTSISFEYYSISNRDECKRFACPGTNCSANFTYEEDERGRCSFYEAHPMKGGVISKNAQCKNVAGCPFLCGTEVWGVSIECDRNSHTYVPMEIAYDFYLDLLSGTSNPPVNAILLSFIFLNTINFFK